MRFTHRKVARLGAAGFAALLFAAAMPIASAGETNGVLAEFEGTMIDLAEDWGEATACHIGDDVAMCFRSEADMDSWLESNSEARTLGPIVIASSCLSTLRLYDGTGWTGSSLSLSTGSQWLNLSNYGFDQKTSSYKIGACAAQFADLSGGGGGWYLSSLTTAYSQYPSMQSGWDNDVSSVYIY
ncbi:MAG: hypothetical protein ABFR95_04225 [Actinomycetota bacterium]